MKSFAYGLIGLLLGATVIRAGIDVPVDLSTVNSQISAVNATMVQQQGSIATGNATKWCGVNLVCDGGTLDQSTSVAPASGFNSVIPDGFRYYVIGTGGVLALGTLKMPANPVDGQRVTVVSKSTVITLFTMQANTGQTLYGGLGGLVVNGFGTWLYQASSTSWLRVA